MVKSERMRYRIVKAPLVKFPNYWGVQRLAGYTDGRPSYELIRRFNRKSDAVAFAALKNHGFRDSEILSES